MKIGTAHPNYKHGRYSAYIGAGLAGKMARELASPDLLSMREEIALVGARISTLLEAIEGGVFDIEGIRKAWADIEAARRTENVAALENAFRRMSDLMHGVPDVKALWDDVGKNVETRRRLVRDQHRILVTEQTMLTGEEALNFAETLLEAIRSTLVQGETITDATFRTIEQHFVRAVGGDRLRRAIRATEAAAHAD